MRYAAARYLRDQPLDATISSLIASAEAGDRAAADALFPALYAELHRLARRELGLRAPQATLGATTLLHEAYLDIARREGVAFPDRARFMTYAARVMRGLIVDYVRRRQAQKRGGQFEITGLVEDAAPTPQPAPAAGVELTALAQALDELAEVDPELAQLVDLKFFCGFTFAEIAEMRAVTERTVQRHWEKARIYLHRILRAAEPGAP
jgi:RNA polymerase sigma factor (TIGR02999 family)